MIPTFNISYCKFTLNYYYKILILNAKNNHNHVGTINKYPNINNCNYSLTINGWADSKLMFENLKMINFINHKYFYIIFFKLHDVNVNNYDRYLGLM